MFDDRESKIPETVLYVAQVAGVKRIRMLVVESWEYESLELHFRMEFRNFYSVSINQLQTATDHTSGLIQS
jgi:hypothetical protein